ncbi:MAG: hypothetical protein R6V85_21185 [Polyangia bacterium]
MSAVDRRPESLGWDYFAAAIGWLPLILLDPWTAAAVGLPAAAVLIFARRVWWAGRPVRGRVALAVLLPVISLSLVTSLALGIGGLSLALLLAGSIVALAEGWNRRWGRTLIRRFPLVSTAAFLALGAGLGLVMFESGVTPYPSEEFLGVLEEPPDGPDWSVETGRQAVGAARATVMSGASGQEEIAELRERLAGEYPELAEAEAPHGAYVTLFESSGYRARGRCDGPRDGLDAVIRAAAEAAGRSPRDPRSDKTRPRAWAEPHNETIAMVDVLGPTRSITPRALFHLFGEAFASAHRSLRAMDDLPVLMDMAYSLEPGVDGIHIYDPALDSSAAILPEEPLTEGWLTPRKRSEPRKMLSMLRRAWYHEHREVLDAIPSELEVVKFRATTFVETSPGGEVIELYRGNELLDEELGRDELVRRIAAASDWLARMVEPDGSFHYEIHPPFREETTRYNLPRHAGSVYGLLAVHTAGLEEPGLAGCGRRALDAALRATGYIERNLGSPAGHGTPEDLCFLDENKRSTSGNTALAALAINELPRPERVKDPALRARVERIPAERHLERMGDSLLEMIDPDGAVFRSFRDGVTEEYVEKEPLYYPGETMLALVRAYRRIEKEELLEGARRIGDRQLRIYGWNLALGIPRAGDHWIMQALSELAEITGEQRYAELAVLMGRGYIREQYPRQALTYPDYLGAYRRVADLPRTTRAASRGEALGGALRAALQIGADTDDFERALILGARHLAEQQLTERNSYFIPRAWDVEGAIRMGVVDNHCRIDNNQHAVVGMLAALEAIDLRSGR